MPPYSILKLFLIFIKKGVENVTRISDLMEKDVICLEDGQCLGRVCDAEIDICNQQICAVIILGRLRFFGLFGREDDVVINWCDIELIGEDTILVKKVCGCRQNKKKKRRFLI